MAEPVWMLDTNVLSDMIRNPRGELVQRLRELEPDAVCTSIVVACELRFGARRKGSDVLTQRVEQLLDTLTVLPLDEPAGHHYADIRSALERSGTPIGGHDLFIAAHARFSNLILVTRSTREFERVSGLSVEDWSAAHGQWPPERVDRVDVFADAAMLVVRRRLRWQVHRGV